MVVKIKKNIAISESGFVFNPSTGDSFTLNTIGAEILRMLASGKDMDAVSEFIVGTYDVEKSVFERYFLDFISMLRQFQILEEDDER
ncbi:MAG TPA: PqqD family protein [Bacteroidales bacterium]|nr:PqqD family protein [Bacteroidales bacterium]HOV11974.1 PqqD family protein [Bacteroidales bacterium]HPS27198.1 PqqD family protein [Bacteroidales bacterium]HQI71030.1 PqqD family protein [Bacteroidales bacterium]